MHFEGFAVIAFSLAGFARHVNIRQKVHLNLEGAVTRACFASTAFNVERKPSGGISAHFSLIRLGKELTNMVEHAGVCRRIRPRSTPNRRLVNMNNLIQMFQTVYLLVTSWNLFCTVEFIRQ